MKINKENLVFKWEWTKETVLTEREFYCRLQHLKDVGLLQEKPETW